MTLPARVTAILPRTIATYQEAQMPTDLPPPPSNCYADAEHIFAAAEASIVGAPWLIIVGPEPCHCDPYEPEVLENRIFAALPPLERANFVSQAQAALRCLTDDIDACLFDDDLEADARTFEEPMKRLANSSPASPSSRSGQTCCWSASGIRRVRSICLRGSTSCFANLPQVSPARCVRSMTSPFASMRFRTAPAGNRWRG